MRRSIIFALVVLVVSLLGRPLRAESTLVVLARPYAQNATVGEAITRIRGELIADGFDVLVVDAPPFADRGLLLTRGDPQTNPAATLGVFLQADAKAAELWVIDRITNKTVVRSVEIASTPGGSAPEVLARRVVELLRASWLEILVDARQKPATSSASREKASRWVAESIQRQPSRWGVEAGALLLAGFGKVGAAVIPVGRVRVDLGQHFVGRVTVSGLGTRPRVESTGGSATLSQALGLLELLGAVAPRAWLKPMVSLGAGAYYVGVVGSAPLPYAGLEGDRLVFAGDAGAGFAVSLGPRFALSLEGHATLVAPQPVIRFLDADSTNINGPLLSAALTLVARL